jgi:tRNA A37 methylthiotransferase MiaB
VAPYFDLSFQHSSEPVLRRMRRFGSTERFLALLESVRAIAPEAGVRSNFIVGFPGETEADVAELERFLTEGRLDAVGIFQYSDEDGTEAARVEGKVPAAEAAGFEGKVPAAEAAERYERLTRLAEELTAQRAEDRIGSTVDVLVESVAGESAGGESADGETGEGRSEHQAPEVDGITILHGPGLRVGEFVRATVTGSDGVDLIATVGP